MISALISWRQSIARTGSEPEGELADRRVVTLDGAELGCLGRLLSCRVIDIDKSEGVVKTEISWAVREHRFFAREG